MLTPQKKAKKEKSCPKPLRSFASPFSHQGKLPKNWKIVTGKPNH
jgi:hypothetical protein